MKKTLLFLATILSVSTAQAGITCVYTKTKVLSNGYLAVEHPITVYREPNTTSESKTITEPSAYYVTGKKDGFLKLADARYYEKDPNYAFSGWGKVKDFDSVAFRNCTVVGQ
jgi:hypothetical protein